MFPIPLLYYRNKCYVPLVVKSEFSGGQQGPYHVFQCLPGLRKTPDELFQFPQFRLSGESGQSGQIELLDDFFVGNALLQAAVESTAGLGNLADEGITHQLVQGLPQGGLTVSDREGVAQLTLPPKTGPS